MSSNRSADTEAIASDWLVRRESGHWTQADQLQLEQWLDAATLNRVAFLRLELAWEECARLKALGAGVAGDEPPPPGSWNITPCFDSHPPADARRRGWRFAAAASVVLAVLAGFGASQLQSHSSDRYVTPVGGRASVPMLDGSKITLNTNSQLRVALTETLRRVDLHQGEAFFEVAKDAQRPFVVAAGNKRVVAVGTKFSVRRDGDDIEVVVTEGKVRVEDNARPEPSELLTAGAIARAGDVGVRVERRSLEDAETHLSWRSGVLMFRDQSLGAAAAELNRYNIRQIVIDDAAVGALKVEGNFTATNLDAFVRLIESGFPVRATHEDRRIILSSR